MYFGLAGVTKNTFEVHDIAALQGKCLVWSGCHLADQLADGNSTVRWLRACTLELDCLRLNPDSATH